VTDRQARDVGGAPYARHVINPMSRGTVRGRRYAGLGLNLLIFIVGSVIDFCAVVNVPAGATFTDGAVTVTAFGTLLVLVSLMAWGTVFWRRTHPLVALIAGGLLAVIGITYLLMLVGAVSAIRRHPSRLRLIALAASAVVVLFALREAFTPWGGALAWFLTRSAEGDAMVWSGAAAIAAMVSLALTAAVVFSSRARDRAVQSNDRAEYERHRADVFGEQVVRQAERERIARDMHDALAHRLSVVSLHAGALESAGAGPAGDIARTVREQTHAALEDMRGLIGELRSEPRETAPSTMRAIGSLLGELRGAGTRITAYVLLESPERASAQFDSAVHRIVQEALTNAIKHATSVPVDVHVQVQPSDGARIRVVNSLSAPRPTAVPGGGHGVQGIRERAAALGGTAWIGIHEGEFIVDVALPWQAR